MELLYLPPISEYRSLIGKAQVTIDLRQPYKKMGFQNRAIIPAANGLINLSIPVKGGRDVKASLKDIMIDNTQSWQIRHWRAITSAYNRSPWFEFFEPTIRPFFHCKYERLYVFNLELLNWLKTTTGVGTEILVNEQEAGSQLETVHLRTSTYSSIEIAGSCPEYVQVFADRIGFQVNMSIVDLLFNEGKAGLRLLRP